MGTAVIQKFCNTWADVILQHKEQFTLWARYFRTGCTGLVPAPCWVQLNGTENTVIKQLQEHSSRHQQHFCMLQKFLSHFSQEKQLCVHSMTTFTASSVQNLIARQCFYYHNDNRNGSLTPNVCVYTCAHSANQCFQHHYLGVAQWNKQTKWNKIHYC